MAPPAPGKYDFTLNLGTCRLCGGETRVSVKVDGQEVASVVNASPALGMGFSNLNGVTGAVANQHHS